jgi:DNA-binding cell septation regulator SpoVG
VRAFLQRLTRVKIFPSNDEGVAAYASITINDCFAIHGLVLMINKTGGYSLQMPQRKRANGMHVDMVAPLDNGTRRMIEDSSRIKYLLTNR